MSGTFQGDCPVSSTNMSHQHRAISRESRNNQLTENTHDRSKLPLSEKTRKFPLPYSCGNPPRCRNTRPGVWTADAPQDQLSVDSQAGPTNQWFQSHFSYSGQTGCCAVRWETVTKT